MESKFSWDGSLEDWQSVWEDIQQDKEEHGGEIGLLVGNGASCAIWRKFAYSSLYEVAQGIISHPLSEAEITIFQHMGKTTDFERVLNALWTAKTVCQALEQDTTAIEAELEARYINIKDALIEAVHAVHISYSDYFDQLERTLGKVQKTLTEYDVIYSTNYDLLLYWAIMVGGTPAFKDYFWTGGCCFDGTNINVIGSKKRVFYLHGGLHLVRLPSGIAMKLTAELAAERKNLLTRFSHSFDDGQTPLFISEGTAEDKLTAIHNSDYLGFAYQQFSQHYGPLVIFGHSLGDHDEHLNKVMSEWNNRLIAISIRPEKKSRKVIAAIQASLAARFPKANVRFFNSTTHPLGHPGLEIKPNGESNS